MKVLHIFTLATAATFFDGQFKYLVEHGQDITIACTPDNSVEVFAKENQVRYLPIEISRTLSPRRDFKTLCQLVAIIKREGFDIIVGHTPKGALLAMMAAKMAGASRRVYFRHGLIYTTATGIKRFILKTEEQFVSAIATHIVNVSPSLSNLAIKDRLNPSHKQFIIGKGTCGGIDTANVFNPKNIDQNHLALLRKNLGISEDDFIIGFCGRLCKDKGIPELIDGFDLFRSKEPSRKIKLLLVGDYDERDVLSPSIHQKIETDPDIILTGFILKDIQYFYALMDVFVFPSHREGFGMCSIEAQSMGVAALVAKSHGCIDTIVEGLTGEYIDLTPGSICDQIASMLDEQRRKSYGMAARKWVCDNFERTTMWPLIKHLYDETIFADK